VPAGMWETGNTVQTAGVCRFCLVAVVDCSYWIDQLTLGVWWMYVRGEPHDSETGRI
jgi:hypothetical protein